MADEKTIEILERLNKEQETNNKLKKEALELEKKVAQALGDQRESRFADLELQKLALEERIKLLEPTHQELDSHREITKEIQKRREEREKLKQQLEGINSELEVGRKAAQESDKFWGSIAGHIGMGRTALDDLGDGATKLAEKMKNSDEHAKQFAMSFKKSFSISRLFSNVLMTMVSATAKLALEADNAASGFAAATGMGNQFRDVIVDAGQAQRDLGVGLKQSAEATQALVTGTSNFVNMSKSAQKEMVQQTAALARLGVDLGTASEMIQFFNLNLGQSQAQAIKTTQRVAMMGTQLGISAAQMSKDFQAALPTLAVYGDRAVDVFEGLATAAKAAGVQMGSLLSITAQFDTFAGAAEAAGKLNAILGTQLSATEMLLQTEDQRLETMIGTIQANGTAFKDMDRFTQKAVAAAAGITDMNEAQKIFGMNMGQYKAHRSEMAAAEASQKKLKDAVQATIPIQEMLTIAFSEFAVALLPVIEGVRGVLTFVIQLLEKTPEGVKQFIGFAIAGGFLFKMIAPLIGVLGGLGKGLGLLTAATPPATAAMTGLGTGISTFGQIVANPKVILGIAAITAAVIGLAYAYSLYADSKAKNADAEAREQEAIAKQIEGYSKLGNAAADVAALRQEIEGFKDINVDAKATLTNLAFISAGKAAEAGTNAIIDGRNFDIQNNLENIFKPTIEIKIDGDALDNIIENGVHRVNAEA
jgi:hypothetical protein